MKPTLTRSTILLLVLTFPLTAPYMVGGLKAAIVGDWQRHAPSHTPRTEGAAIVYQDKLYALGGFTRDVEATHLSEAYIPARETWIQLAPIPRAVSHVGAVQVDGKIWLVGGFEGDHPGPALNIVQIYDPQTDNWSTGPSLPAPRASGTLALLGRRLHYVGGLLPDRDTDIGEHIVLDVDNVSAGWIPAAPLPEPRNHLSSAVYEGKLFAIGGQFGHDGGRTITALVHMYDSTSDEWKRLADLPIPISHAEASTFVYNDSIVVAGGVGPGHERRAAIDLIMAYDPALDRWTEIGTLPQQLLGAGAGVINERLYVANGSIDVSWNAQDSTWSRPTSPRVADTLGFWPEALDIEIESGRSEKLEVLVWTHAEEVPFEINTDGFPDWLGISNQRAERASPSAAPLLLMVDASEIEAGTYNATLQVFAEGYDPASLPIMVSVTQVHTGAELEAPADAQLLSLSNSPNPFDGQTTIRYALPKTGPVVLSVYNLLGRQVALLVDGPRAAGAHEVILQADHLASGTYVCVLRVGDSIQVQRIILTR